MQSGTGATNASAMARQTNRQPFAIVTVDDQRLRGFTRADHTTPAAVYPFDALAIQANQMLRAWNLSSANPGVLYYGLAATDSDNPTFTSVNTSNNARRHSGVAVFADQSIVANQIDIFFFDTSNPPNLKRIRSTAATPSFGAASTVSAMPENQRSQHRPQIACAGWSGGSQAPYLFYTSVSNTDRTLGTNLLFYDGPGTFGAAGTHYRCTLGDLGLPVMGSSVPIGGISAYKVNATDFLCVLLINHPRQLAESGLYAIWFRDGLWSTPYPIFTYPDAPSGNALYTLHHPTLTKIGSTYWVLAVETMTIAGLSTSSTPKVVHHLVAFRAPADSSNSSFDATFWSDRIVLAGTDMRYSSGGSAYAYGLNDFLMSRLVVNATRTFLVNYGSPLQCQTTSLVSSTAADYAARQLDLTPDVEQFSLSLPSGPGGQGRLTLQNPDKKYNSSSILRRGSRIVIQAGYRIPSVTDANSSVTLFTGLIDEVRQRTDERSNQLDLIFRDEALKRLADWKSDVYWEYSSGRQIYVPNILDYSSVIQAQGNWTLQANSASLIAGLPPGVYNNPDKPKKRTPLCAPDTNIVLANTGRVQDGIFDVKFTFNKQLKGGSAGIVFRYVDNANFYHVVYNEEKGAWDLKAYDGSTTPVSLLTAPVSPEGTLPAANETWWLRIVLYHNILVAYARKDRDTTIRWTRIFGNEYGATSNFAASARLKTRAGYFGFAAKGKGLATKSAGNTSFWTTHFDAGTAETYDHLAARFTCPTPLGATTVTLASISVQLHLVSAAGGTLDFKILKDDGSGQAPMTEAAGTIHSVSLPASEVLANNGGWTVVYPTSTVTLNCGSRYWICVAPHVTGCLGAWWLANDTGPEVDGVTDDGSSGSGQSWSGVGMRFIYAVEVSADGGSVGFKGYALASQEEPVTLHTLTRHIAAKAGVLSHRARYFLNEDFAGALGTNWDTAGARGTWTISGGALTATNAGASDFGFLRCTAATLKGLVLEADMRLGSSTSAAGFMLSQQKTGALGTDSNLQGFYIEFDASTDKCNIHVLNTGLPNQNNRIYQGAGFINIQHNKTYRVKIQHSGGWIVVYLNNILMAAVTDLRGLPDSVGADDLKPAGYICLTSYGNASPAVTFDNVQIAELRQVKDYFVIEENMSGQQALERLYKYSRIQFYGDYDGALRFGVFDNVGASVVTYGPTLVRAEKVDSDRYWVSQVRPFGDYAADRWSGDLLDSDGRRFASLDYTDARSDKGAFREAAYPLRRGRETTSLYQFRAAADPALQREDRITIQNNADGTNGDYLVDALQYEFRGGENPVFDMDVSARAYVAQDAETAAG